MPLNVHTKAKVKIRDPYKMRERYERWDKTVPGANPKDRAHILQYIQDMEDGRNVGGSKGERSYVRLYTLRSRMVRLSQLIHEHTQKTLITVTDEDLHKLFKGMRTGKITKASGGNYTAVADYVKTFKSFWHWHQRTERRKGRQTEDITIDLDTSREKPRFHYLTYDKVKLLADAAKYEYRVLIWFLYDSGMRPSEMQNIRASDLELSSEGVYSCTIREETSKTFGRKIKLLLSSSLLKEYLQRKEIKEDAFFWRVSMTKTGQYLRRLGARVLQIPDLSMYDLRHSSACYWLPRYKSESALKYRFGWMKSEMIHYYTEFLGMKDTISQEDLIDSEDKTRLQQELERQRQQLAIMEEKMSDQNNVMVQLVEAKLQQILRKHKLKAS